MDNLENKKPVAVLRGLPTEQSPTAGPVITLTGGAAMEKTGEVKTVLRNTLLPLMGAGTPVHTGGAGQMDPLPSRLPTSAILSAKPQEPKAGNVASAADGYVRLEVHADNGKLTITAAKHVPGPLSLPSALIRGYAYEVLVDDQQVGLGSLPDVGIQRAFANRDVEGPQGKHHIGRLPTFDFSVRIPAGLVVAPNLPKLNVVLHNVQDAPDRLPSLAPLDKQPGVKTVEVGRLAGIALEQLSPVVRTQFERLLSLNGSGIK
jgi:hypothetical protein